MIKAIIVDDEPLALEVLETYISRIPEIQLVQKCENAFEANEALKNHQIDLMFLDIQMPQLSGIEFLKTLANPPCVIFTTAYPDYAVEGFELNATDYLLKPLNPEALLSRTESLLKRQSLERRRRELNTQITSLQDELRRLEGDPSVAADKVVQVPVSDRFLKRSSLIVDLQARRTTFSEREVQLPPAAFDYLVVLTRHSPDVVDYQTLVTEAQGYQTDRREAQELAKWHIHELRDSLEPDPGNPRHVLNVRGVGYRLIVD